MSIINLPAFYMYWASETRYPPVADVMPIARYKALRQNLHVSDNAKCNDPENKDNKLYKIPLVLDHVRENCILLEPEIEHSVDDQIIPAKTSCNGIHQYNPKKPVKWGFKNFVRSGESGFMYNFFLYSGSVNGQKYTGSYVVLKLLETLPKYEKFKIFFNNWGFFIPLCLALKDCGYLATATLTADRTKGCPLPAEKDLKKQGKGSQFQNRCEQWHLSDKMVLQ